MYITCGKNLWALTLIKVANTIVVTHKATGRIKESKFCMYPDGPYVTSDQYHHQWKQMTVVLYIDDLKSCMWTMQWSLGLFETLGRSVVKSPFFKVRNKYMVIGLNNSMWNVLNS